MIPKQNPQRSKTPAITFAALAFLLPNLVGFCVFTLFPVVLSLGMAFTNWSLKPAVKLRFTGLTNFRELLGIHTLQAGEAWVPVFYYAGGILMVVSFLGWLSRLHHGGKGTGLGGLIFGILGMGMIAVAAREGAHHLIWILAVVALVHGGATWWGRRGDYSVGLPLWFSLGTMAGVLAIWLLHRAMWSHYEPNDWRFWYYLYNTGYLMLSLPLNIAGALGLAMLLNEDLNPWSNGRKVVLVIFAIIGVISVCILWSCDLKNWAMISGLAWVLAGLGVVFGKISFRTVFYLPTFTSGVAIMILWKMMLNPQTGLINTFLSHLLHRPVSELPLWLSSVDLAKPSLMLMGFWLSVGGMNMLLYLAGLTNVPQELLEAAAMDGAGRWQKFTHVYWPNLLPTTFFISIMSVIGGLQGGFEQAKVMTDGGPAGATTTLAYYIYTLGFEDMKMGYVATVSWVMFIILFGLTVMNWKLGKDMEI